MLNKIWLALLVIGITAAFVTDLFNLATDKYQNGKTIPVSISLDKEPGEGKQVNGQLEIDKEVFKSLYKTTIHSNLTQAIKIIPLSGLKQGTVILTVNENTPAIWKEIAKASGKENEIIAEVFLGNKTDSVHYSGTIILEKVSFTKMQGITFSALESVKTAVTIAFGLIGIMALWLGLMKMAEEAGLLKIISNALKPLTKFLFPDVPQDHPAMGAMVMNISANMLGLGNAATPFGLKAMEELDKLNPEKGTATNAMCTFLAINTAGLTLIPATAIAIRAASGSSNPAIIIGTSLFGAGCATIAGITAAKFFEKLSNKGFDRKVLIGFLLKSFGIFAVLALSVFVLFQTGALKSMSGGIADVFRTILQIVSIVAIPFVILSFTLYAYIKKVKVYESFIEGAKEGFNIAIKIIPYLVAMLCAIAIFRAGGGMDFLVSVLTPATNLIGMPAESVPMAFLRPLSGSGSLGLMSEIITTHGPDSFVGVLVSTMFGSTETTFYVIALYFGSVNIKRTRHALTAGLIADFAGMMGALFIVRLLFGLL